MAVFSEQLHPGSFIVSERGRFYSRDEVTLLASAAIAAGTVLGKSGVPADESFAVAAATGNAGNGTLTMDATAPLTSSAINGDYQIDFLDPTHYEVSDPSSVVIGEGTVATPFSDQIKFNIATGATAFVAGDRFTVTVTRQVIADELYVPLNPSATDGTQFAAAVLVYPVRAIEAGAGNRLKRAVVSRSAEVRASDLTWPSGITAVQQAEATNQLALLGIELR